MVAPITSPDDVPDCALTTTGPSASSLMVVDIIGVLQKSPI